MELTLRSITTEAQDIVSLELVSPRNEALPPFSAGAHIDLKLGNGLTRSYSLVNDPAETHRYVVAVNKDPASRGGSQYIHEQLRSGQSLEVSVPKNHFALVEDAPLVMLVGGGIGITPLYCMIQRLEALDKPWKLFYSARNRQKCAYLSQIMALEAKHPGRVQLHFMDEAGGVPDLKTILAAVPAAAHVYCCGPSAMLQAFEQATATRKPDTVHVEYFSAQQEAAVAGGYEVMLARSQRSFQIQPGKTILDVLLAHGVAMSHACQEGVCGACQTTVLEGTPDHRDSFLTPREKSCGKTMLVCCSGSLSDRLVLDL
ncbi:MAG: PDR/VanB family oxidoreductase [Giesbergeria sp.]|uniref:PDR/VanB family oxidoreductase n=1 Tax=Giesbergeria sp. TaxID=2818473 RepID=UPI002613D95E|nr:PDR/VanB family oxidoreductase [Giesbergeria sp.]MDD2610211.1 PDR/VanB family oxidoreductase [Giesbergeria sp.]